MKPWKNTEHFARTSVEEFAEKYAGDFPKIHQTKIKENFNPTPLCRASGSTYGVVIMRTNPSGQIWRSGSGWGRHSGGGGSDCSWKQDQESPRGKTSSKSLQEAPKSAENPAVARVRLADLNGPKIGLFKPNWTRMDHFGPFNAKIRFGIRSF